jgi:hypothetical protein
MKYPNTLAVTIVITIVLQSFLIGHSVQQLYNGNPRIGFHVALIIVNALVVLLNISNLWRIGR